MEESKEEIASWMIELADKHDIEVDTILEFYNSTQYDRNLHQTKRKRTEEFFNLYFEGVKEGK